MNTKHRHKCGSAIYACTCGNGVQKFSEESTLHGFRELYYAKSIVWKVIWILAILIAIGLSVLQLYGSIVSALEEPTTTTIEPLLQSSPKYPSLKICYLHWVYWINWNTAKKLGFGRSSILYAVSFLNDIVTMETFDYEKSKSDFLTTMNKHNFTTLTQFYSAVSDPTPPGITVNFLDWSQQWVKVIDPSFGRLCYVAPNELIQKGLSLLANQDTDFKHSIQLSVNYDYFVLNEENIKPMEYIIYAKAYITFLLKHDLPANDEPTKYLTFKPAPILNVDDVRVNLIMPTKDTFQSVIKITGSLYNWLDTDKRHCNPGEVKPYHSYCDKICYWREVQRTNQANCMNIEGAVLFNQDAPENVCPHKIYYLQSGKIQQGSYLNTSQQQTSQFYNSCIAEYCMTPCEEWKYTSTVSSLPVPPEIASLNFPTLLYVQYPTSSSILVFTEVKTQTWETIIGNVGGILGLWLGASILSIIQMFYLLCCNLCDSKMHESCDRILNGSFRKYQTNYQPKKKPTIRPNTVVLPKVRSGRKKHASF